MSANAMNPDVLERRAAQQRQQLATCIVELRDNVREKADVRRQVRDHFGLLAGVAGFVSFVFGYAVASIFARR